MDFLSNIVQQVITVLYNMTATVGLPNYGLAIIIMTIIVKILLYPLTKKQIESTKAMMAMQPKMKAIQEKYKNDKQRLNMELANLYKSGKCQSFSWLSAVISTNADYDRYFLWYS